MRYIADREAIDRLVQRTVRERSRRILSGIFVAIAGSFSVLFIPLIAGDGWQGLTAYIRAEPWAALGVPFALAVFLAAMVVHQTYSAATTDASRIARRIERDWLRLTDKRWMVRVTLWGVALALAIGVPIGILMAVTARPSELAELGGHFGIVARFTSMTLIWTVPGAFMIRYLSVRSYRPLLRLEGSNDASPPPSNAIR